MNEDNRPLSEIERAVDKQIREAMARGEFENLRGAGKPLNLDANPYTPADWQMAFKILQDAEVAPEWIEWDKEIRAERATLAQWLARQAEWQRARRARIGALPPEQWIAEREHLAATRDSVCAQFRQRATTLNQLIDTFNLKAPNPQLHHARLRIEEDLRRFEDACQ